MCAAFAAVNRKSIKCITGFKGSKFWQRCQDVYYFAKLSAHISPVRRGRERERGEEAGRATRTCCTYASTARVALCFICLNGNQSSNFFARQMAQKLNWLEQEIKLMVSHAWRVHVFTLCLRSTSEFLSHFFFALLILVFDHSVTELYRYLFLVCREFWGNFKSILKSSRQARKCR